VGAGWVFGEAEAYGPKARSYADSQSIGGTGVQPVQGQDRACGYKKLLFDCKLALEARRQFANGGRPGVGVGAQRRGR
jgi:hypothetical protein